MFLRWNQSAVPNPISDEIVEKKGENTCWSAAMESKFYICVYVCCRQHSRRLTLYFLILSFLFSFFLFLFNHTHLRQRTIRLSDFHFFCFCLTILTLDSEPSGFLIFVISVSI